MNVAIAEPPANHSIALWVICAGFSLSFLAFVVATRFFWRIPAGTLLPKISTDRAEKSCDAVLSVCALLIPATLGLLTWLHEKVGVGSYMIPLGFALLYFFVLLIFTAYLRFNFLWQHDKDFEVSSQRNLRFGYWLTTATSSIVLGLILLSIPVLEMGFGWLKVKETQPKDAPVRVECNCKSTDAAPPPVSMPRNPVSTHHRKPQSK
jgi:hypothetical protein